MPRALTLSLLPGRYAVCRLPAGACVPEWSAAGELQAVVRTPHELSLVCDEAGVPPDVRRETGWRALAVQGPLAFTETGVLAAIAAPLAAQRVGIFVLSSYDTDYVLVQQAHLARAVAALRDAGHRVSE